MRLKTSARRGELESQLNRSREEVDRLRGVTEQLQKQLRKANRESEKVKAPGGLESQLVLAREEVMSTPHPLPTHTHTLSLSLSLSLSHTHTHVYL
jgi:TolA-binding protein